MWSSEKWVEKANICLANHFFSADTLLWNECKSENQINQSGKVVFFYIYHSFLLHFYALLYNRNIKHSLQEGQKYLIVSYMWSVLFKLHKYRCGIINTLLANTRTLYVLKIKTTKRTQQNKINTQRLSAKIRTNIYLV